MMGTAPKEVEPREPHAGGQFNAPNSPANESDVRLASGGDAEAFGRLYERYAERIQRHVLAKVGNTAVAEDLSAQVFLNAWQSMERFHEIEGRPFVAWLFNIANNLVIDHFRRSRREVEGSDEVERVLAGGDPQDHAVNLALRGELESYIQRLKPEQRLILTLRMVDGLKYAEIAELLGKSPGSVRVILFRALAALRKQMRGRESEF